MPPLQKLWRRSESMSYTKESDLPAQAWLDFFADPVRTMYAVPDTVSCQLLPKGPDDVDGRRTYESTFRTRLLGGLKVSYKQQMGGALKDGEQQLLDEAFGGHNPLARLVLRTENRPPIRARSLSLFTVEAAVNGEQRREASVVRLYFRFDCPRIIFSLFKRTAIDTNENLLDRFEENVRAGPGVSHGEGQDEA